MSANRLWLFELLCLSINLISLIAMVIILQRYDGKDVPRWPLRLTINSLLAILATVFKGTLIFPISEG